MELDRSEAEVVALVRKLDKNAVAASRDLFITILDLARKEDYPHFLGRLQPGEAAAELEALNDETRARKIIQF